MSKYTKQADKFLKDYQLEFCAELIGNDCPHCCQDAVREKNMQDVAVFPRKTHIHGQHYRYTISRKNGTKISFDYWNSYLDAEFNYCQVHRFDPAISETLLIRHGIKGKSLQSVKIPTPYDLLACLTKNDPGTFEDFCSDYGYDTDSRHAESIYRAVQKNWKKIREFFTAEEVSIIQSID